MRTRLFSPRVFLVLAAFAVGLTALAQGEPPAAEELPPGPSAASDSFFDLIVKGGFVMIPLALCSVVATTVFFERYVALNRERIAPPQFLPGLEALMKKKPNEPEAHLKYCEDDGSPLAEVIRSGLANKGQEPAIIDRAMGDTAALEMRKIRRSLRSLRLVAGIAPLLGLLGTVAGMIRAFQTVALSSSSLGRAEMLAQGIYEAMVTTATGLIIAIPTLLVHALLVNRVDNLGDEIETVTNRFIERHLRPGKRNAA